MTKSKKATLQATIATKQFSKPLGIIKMPRSQAFSDRKNGYNRQQAKQWVKYD